MKVQHTRILFSRVVRRFFNPLKLQRSSFVFAPWSKSSFHKREKSLQRKMFYCSLYTFLFFKNICHNVHESLPWDCFCDARLLYILFLCSLNLCQPFTCKKKKIRPYLSHQTSGLCYCRWLLGNQRRSSASTYVFYSFLFIVVSAHSSCVQV